MGKKNKRNEEKNNTKSEMMMEDNNEPYLSFAAVDGARISRWQCKSERDKKEAEGKKFIIAISTIIKRLVNNMFC